MNKRLSIEHSGARGRSSGLAGGAVESRRSAVVEAARNLVRTRGAVAFMNREKATAWANLQVAIDSLESAR